MARALQPIGDRRSYLAVRYTSDLFDARDMPGRHLAKWKETRGNASLEDR